MLSADLPGARSVIWEYLYLGILGVLAKKQNATEDKEQSTEGANHDKFVSRHGSDAWRRELPDVPCEKAPAYLGARFPAIAYPSHKLLGSSQE